MKGNYYFNTVNLFFTCSFTKPDFSSSYPKEDLVVKEKVLTLKNILLLYK